MAPKAVGRDRTADEWQRCPPRWRQALRAMSPDRRSPGQRRRSSRTTGTTTAGSSLPASRCSASRLAAFQRDVFEGAGVREILNQAEPRFTYPRPRAVDKPKLPDRRINGPLGEDLLHLVQDLAALLAVQLGRLLLVERVDVGITAIDVGAPFDDVSFKARRGIAKGAAAAQDQVLQLLVGIGLDKSRPLERPQLGADPNRLEVVEQGFGDMRVGGVAEELAGVEATGMSRLSQQLLGLVRVVSRQGRLPKELEGVRDDAARDLRIAEGDRVVHGLAVDRKAAGPSNPLVVPGRLRVPLVGVVNPERSRREHRLESETRRTAQFFGQFCADRIHDVDVATIPHNESCRLFPDGREVQAHNAWRLPQ